MNTPLPQHAPLAHPVDAPGASAWEGILPLNQYALIIDARTPGEFAEDHIHGAVNLPVVSQEQYAEVGTLHRSDKHTAYAKGVRYSLLNIADMLPSVFDSVTQDAPVLVYCFRGGKRSALWADTLRTVGFNVHVLPGGWKAYRRWVNEQLETLPTRFQYNVLYGSTGCGKTRLLAALQRQGAQVLDLEAMAVHRGSLIGAVPDQDQPTQKLFDGALLIKLLGFDPSKPVWVESESRKIGRRQIPISLHQAMGSDASRVYEVTMSMAHRVQLWREDYSHHATNPSRMVEMLRPIRALIGGEEFAIWQALAADKRVDELFERVMAQHYDPCYARSLTGHFRAHAQRMATVDLQSCEPTELDRHASALLKA